MLNPQLPIELSKCMERMASCIARKGHSHLQVRQLLITWESYGHTSLSEVLQNSPMMNGLSATARLEFMAMVEQLQVQKLQKFLDYVESLNPSSTEERLNK